MNIFLIIILILILFFSKDKECYLYPTSSQIAKKNKKCGCCGAC